MLNWYSQHFDTVEINNSFYRLPTSDALRTWGKQTPANFCFAMKASRYITHNRKLKYPKESVKKLFAQANLLKTRLGPILFQLPPSWKVNVERFEEFVRALPRRRRYAFELRNPTWNIPPIFEVLHKHNAPIAFTSWRASAPRLKLPPTLLTCGCTDRETLIRAITAPGNYGLGQKE